MNDEEIKRLLENVEVKPSAHCWEAISGNLAAGAGAAATAGATKAATHALTTTAKVIIGAVGAAAVATTAVILAVTGAFSPKETNVSEKQIVVTEAARTPETVPTVDEAAPSAQATGITDTPPATRPVAATADESPVAATTGEAAPSEPAPKAAENTAAAAPVPSPTPQAPVSATPAKSSVAPSTPQPAPKPAATTETAPPSPLTDLSDPVLEDAETYNSIDFAPPVALVIPNVITPNGDGFNDVFIIKGIEQTERNRLIIRNSNGSLVFQTVNYRNDWGAPNLPDGTYFYQFVYTLHGIDETRTGTLTIMR